MKVSVELSATGTVVISDKWTDDAIEADPDGFDQAVLDALPKHLSTLDFEVDDAWSAEEAPAT
jgi:hypothetical protein